MVHMIFELLFDHIRLCYIITDILNQQGYVEKEIFNVRWLTTAQKIKCFGSKENEFSTTIWEKGNNGYGHAKISNIEIKWTISSHCSQKGLNHTSLKIEKWKKQNNIQSIHQRRTVELKLQNLNGWEQEDFNEKWDEQPEEKSPTKIYSPPLAPGISVRKVCLKNYCNFNKK